jgi:dTDP-4-dehydrorhamnose reductase
MKILVTGANGQVGWELVRTLSTLGEVVALDRVGADLSNPESLRATVRDIAPRLIVNAAAYTAVDRAESEPDLARRINAEAPGVLAQEAKRAGAWLIHYSTDYVFDGAKAGAYVETDAPNPGNVYGATKRAGEQAIAAAGCRHLILRTSWVYGLRGGNFLLTMRRLAREREELKIVDDQIGAPTWCRSIAEATGQIVAQLLSPQRAPALDQVDLSGVYHLACGGHTSWFGFARAILEQDARNGAPLPKLTPIPTSDYPTPAKRPANSRLDCAKLERVFGVRLPAWEAALGMCGGERER